MSVRVLPFPAVKKRLVLDAVVEKSAVPVAFPKRRVPVLLLVAKLLVDEAVPAKKLVEVLLVDVLFVAVKFWRVEEPVATRFPNVPVPVVVIAPPFALVKAKVFAKNEVLVAFVEVEFRAVTFWSVVEPVARRFPNVPRPDAVSVVKVLVPVTVTL